MLLAAQPQRKAIADARVKKGWWVIRISKPLSKMNRFNRDLLVLFKEELMNPQAIEHEVEMLHELLYCVEKIDNLSVAHEVINVNKHKIYHDDKTIRNTLREHDLKAFIFLNNKN